MSEAIEYRKLVAELRERAGLAELENTATARSDARYFREAASALEDLIELAERVEAAALVEVVDNGCTVLPEFKRYGAISGDPHGVALGQFIGQRVHLLPDNALPRQGVEG